MHWAAAGAAGPTQTRGSRSELTNDTLDIRESYTSHKHTQFKWHRCHHDTNGVFYYRMFEQAVFFLHLLSYYLKLKEVILKRPICSIINSGMHPFKKKSACVSMLISGKLTAESKDFVSSWSARKNLMRSDPIHLPKGKNLCTYQSMCCQHRQLQAMDGTVTNRAASNS